MKRIRLCLWLLVGCVFVFFLGKAAWQVKEYIQLDAKTWTSSCFLEVEEKNPSSYAMIATYHFVVEGKEFTSKGEFAKPYFLNRLAATKAVERLHGQSWEVFYRESCPQVSSLQRNFPFLACIHAFLVGAIGVYFFFLKKILASWRV